MPRDFDLLLEPETIRVDKLVHCVNVRRNKLLKIAHVQGEFAADRGEIQPDHRSLCDKVQAFGGLLELLEELDIINEKQRLDIFNEVVEKCDDAFFKSFCERKKWKVDFYRDLPFDIESEED